MRSAVKSPEYRSQKYSYRILVADDHAIVSIGLRMLIADIDNSIQVDEASNGESVIAMLKSGDFDMVILDINMPDTESFSLSGYIIQEFPSVRIMIFTMFRELNLAMRFLQLGVHGYLFKDAREEEMQCALRMVMSGKVYMGDWLSQAVSQEWIAPRVKSPFDKLSDRELEVTLQIVRGTPMTRIAGTLHLNRSTIGSHKSRIIKKLNVANTIELINLAKTCGLI